MNKAINFVCLLIFFFNNVKTAHWVGQSKLRSLYTYDFSKIKPVVKYIQASTTGNTMKYSVSGGGNNTDLLQEEKENIAEEANNNAAVNT